VEATRIACVGAIVHDDLGRLLLVRRGREPGKGLWSVPGGRVEPGESSREAVVRELEEETALRIVPTSVAGVVDRTGPAGEIYEIEDWLAVPASDPALVRAGDDAAAVGWFTAAEIERLACVDGLVDQLRRWQVIPGQRRARTCRAEE
jgi:ADP-ribose pyrophosphatase YjhB (NUDIX family)